MTHPDEIEEMEMRFGPRLWDAGEGVCCAAFQLGACPHTEAFDEENDLPMDWEPRQSRPLPPDTYISMVGR